jgi:anti-sigma-K factor RskA
MPERGPSDDALAFLYASGELGALEAEAFERRLGDEQPLREALCQAVRLVQTLEGSQPPAPRPAYRAHVRRRLRLSAGRGLWRWLAGPRSYRGHPALWAGLGAAAAVLVVLCCSPASRQQAAPPPAVAEQPAPVPEEPAGAAATAEMAEVWATLHSTDHLARARDDENRRRDRRLVRGDERPLRPPALFGERH